MSYVRRKGYIRTIKGAIRPAKTWLDVTPDGFKERVYAAQLEVLGDLIWNMHTSGHLVGLTSTPKCYLPKGES